jgi:hypothetical protein
MKHEVRRLADVVVDDVEDHRDAAVVERLHELLELLDARGLFRRDRVAALRGE